MRIICGHSLSDPSNCYHVDLNSNTFMPICNVNIMNNMQKSYILLVLSTNTWEISCGCLQNEQPCQKYTWKFHSHNNAFICQKKKIIWKTYACGRIDMPQYGRYCTEHCNEKAKQSQTFNWEKSHIMGSYCTADLFFLSLTMHHLCIM